MSGKLKALAEQKQMSEELYLRWLMERYPTVTAAAASIGMSRVGLSNALKRNALVTTRGWLVKVKTRNGAQS